ncbi:putative cupredoxin-like copper-binding protein [Microbacterium sp. ZKA21]|uniref:DUF4012 domain-containing protein n=1 Tax=Microbacterium sp. ZKA21 TaxID=3381694 RepID=UPI003D24B74A
MSDGRLPRHHRRWLGWTIGTLVVLLLVAIGWVAVRGIGATNELQAVAENTSELKTAVAARDLDGAELVADRIAGHAAEAADLTSDPIWRGFEFVPFLGPNFSAVREIAEIAETVSADALTPVLDAAEGLDPADLGFTGTTIDLAPFADAAAPLGRADETLSDALIRARAIDAGATLPPLEDAVGEVRDAVEEAATLVGTLHGAAVLLPSMLGADGPRSYVVAMQNNAEVRSSGGIIGAMALITADNGTIRIVHNASTSDFPRREVPLETSETTVSLFDDQPGLYMQNLTSIPEFTEAGPLIAERWTQRFGGSVDGVIAVDTVVAQHLIAATGPVSFGPFTADADNVLSILMSEIYSAIPDSETQDAVFAEASSALLAAALSSGEPQALLGALSQSSDEGRVRIWSAHEDEQTRLASTALGGALPTDDDDATWVGVLFNDTTGGKMDYYADAAFAVATGVCAGEKITRFQVTWTNNAPADAATALPEYVTAPGWYGVPAGETRTLVAVYGPQGATPVRIDRDGTEEQVQTAVIEGRTVLQHSVQLAPGESTTITVDFTGDGAGDRLTEVAHTPLIRTPEVTRESIDCGS